MSGKADLWTAKKDSVPRDQERYLLLLILINVLPHYFTLPKWIFFSGLVLWLWRAMGLIRNIYVPGPWVANFLGLLFSVGIFFEFGSFLGEQATASVLVLMTVLKSFYLRRYRDLMVLTILCYFLLMAKLLNSQSITVSIFMVVDVILITSVMAFYHSPVDRGHLGAVIKRTYGLALWALPAVFLLFFLFPRFQMGLLQRPPPTQSMTGFSEQLAPGQVAQLMSNDQLVFRATFPNQQRLPPLDQLYWRGAVLSQGQGLNWTMDPIELSRVPDPLPRERWSEFIVQEIFMEPTEQRWLFPLEHPLQMSQPRNDRGRRHTLRDDRAGQHVYRAHQDMTSREYFLAFSSAEAPRWTDLPPEAIEGYLKRFKFIDQIEAPRAQRWLDEQRRTRSLTHSAEWAEVIFEHFQRGGFSYSMSPAEVESVDEFFFETKEGFCEHYAAVGASLLRLAGVAARVIVGFQGGTPSLLGDYLLVRYYDAHAWVEYWDDLQGGWQRWDPTGAVEPSRLSLGASASSDLFAGTGGFGLSGTSNWVGRWLGSEWARTYYQARLAWDQIESSWLRFLMRYDYGAQQDFFRRLGFGQAGRILMFIVSGVALILLMLLVAWWLNRQREPVRGDLRLYRDLSEEIERKLGLARQPWEGPQDYRRRLREHLPPEQMTELEPFFKRFMESRYGPRAMSSEELRSWRRRLRGVKLKKTQSAALPKGPTPA